MVHVVAIASVVMLAVFAPAAAGAGVRQAAQGHCRPDGGVAPVAELPEGSGVAVSQRVPGRLWAHNDSGSPLLVALDARGRATGQLRIAGAGVEDWEALAVGPCGNGSCLYIGDIGDNGGNRDRITIYRVPEPDASATTASVDAVFHAAYPDAAQDAEALLISPDGDVFVVTKGRQGPVSLYRLPGGTRPGSIARLERVGGPLTSGSVDDGARVTDGAISPDGRWVALRTLTTVRIYPAADALGGTWREAARVDLDGVPEPQGEGIAFGADGVVYLLGEGGGGGRPGTLARLHCTL